MSLENNAFQEVRVLDKHGKLKKVVSKEKLYKAHQIGYTQAPSQYRQNGVVVSKICDYEPCSIKFETTDKKRKFHTIECARAKETAKLIERNARIRAKKLKKKVAIPMRKFICGYEHCKKENETRRPNKSFCDNVCKVRSGYDARNWKKKQLKKEKLMLQEKIRREFFYFATCDNIILETETSPEKKCTNSGSVMVGIHNGKHKREFLRFMSELGWFVEHGASKLKCPVCMGKMSHADFIDPVKNQERIDAFQKAKTDKLAATKKELDKATEKVKHNGGVVELIDTPKDAIDVACKEIVEPEEINEKPQRKGASHGGTGKAERPTPHTEPSKEKEETGEGHISV